MHESTRCLPQVFSDQDWHLITVGLRSLSSPRALELSEAILGWRLEVSKAQIAFLEAFREVHK
jgi:hypothetical protein